MIERGRAWPSGMPNRLRQRAGGDVAADHLQGDDLHLLDQLLAQVQPLDEVVLHADRVQPRHHIFADAVVDDALAFQHGLLLGVEGGGVVLEVLDQGAGLGTLVEDLRLALVDLLAAGHACSLLPARGHGPGNESARGSRSGARGPDLRSASRLFRAAVKPTRMRRRRKLVSSHRKAARQCGECWAKTSSHADDQERPPQSRISAPWRRRSRGDELRGPGHGRLADSYHHLLTMPLWRFMAMCPPAIWRLMRCSAWPM